MIAESAPELAALMREAEELAATHTDVRAEAEQARGELRDYPNVRRDEVT